MEGGGGEKESGRGMWIEEKPFRSCHGLRIVVTCLPQIYDVPLNTFSSAYCFSFTRLPLSHLSSRSSPFIPRTLLSVCFVDPSLSSLSLSFSRVFLHSPFFSCCARSEIDRCHRRTNTPGRTCQRVLMSPVIVISTLIRTAVRTSEAFATACAILSIIRLT